MKRIDYFWEKVDEKGCKKYPQLVALNKMRSIFKSWKLYSRKGVFNKQIDLGRTCLLHV